MAFQADCNAAGAVQAPLLSAGLCLGPLTRRVYSRLQGVTGRAGSLVLVISGLVAGTACLLRASVRSRPSGWCGWSDLVAAGPLVRCRDLGTLAVMDFGLATLTLRVGEVSNARASVSLSPARPLFIVSYRTIAPLARRAVPVGSYTRALTDVSGVS